MKRYGFWLSIWVSFFVCFCSLPAAAISFDVDPTERVYDYAGLLSDAEIEGLAAEAGRLAQKYEMDYVIVTIDDDEDMSSIDYAQDFYDYNAFASDGVLLLINMDYRELVVCGTGKGEYIYNESQIERILDEVYKGASQDDFYLACDNFLKKADQIAKRATESAFSRNLRRIPFFLLAAAAIAGISLAGMVSANKLRRTATQASAYIDGEGLKLTYREDRFLRSAVTRTRRNTDSGGRSGGGSSIGSSGRSHSVGSRRF